MLLKRKVTGCILSSTACSSRKLLVSCTWTSRSAAGGTLPFNLPAHAQSSASPHQPEGAVVWSNNTCVLMRKQARLQSLTYDTQPGSRQPASLGRVCRGALLRACEGLSRQQQNRSCRLNLKCLFIEAWYSALAQALTLAQLRSLICHRGSGVLDLRLLGLHARAAISPLKLPGTCAGALPVCLRQCRLDALLIYSRRAQHCTTAGQRSSSSTVSLPRPS